MDTVEGPGFYRLTTLTGSVYELRVFGEPEGDNVGTLRRRPAQVAPADGGAPSEPLRRDEEELQVRQFKVIAGRPGFFVLEPLGDGDVTFRTTSIIQSIELVPAAHVR
jgi:hypothetical protein